MSNAVKFMLVVIVIGVLAGVYFVMQQGGPVGGDGGLQIASEEARGIFGEVATRESEIDSQEILALFSEVSAITIDTGIFQKNAFSSLQDISVLLEQPPVIGRPNPFLPIGLTPAESVDTTLLDVEPLEEDATSSDVTTSGEEGSEEDSV